MLWNHEECLDYLEQIRWHGKPTCPYCGSTNGTAYKKEKRYHCNCCFTSYSVTVGTLFHKTRVDLQKWFWAIILVTESNGGIGVRELAREISVDKNTAMNMIKRIAQAKLEDQEMLCRILQAQHHIKPTSK